MVSLRVLQVLAAAVALAAAGMSEDTHGAPAAAAKKPSAVSISVKSVDDRGPETAKPAASEKGAAGEKTSSEKSAPAKKPAKEEAKAPERTPADAIWAELSAGNKRFMAGRLKERELIKDREELANGQHPEIMVLACADSRVSPELLLDKTLGELFVVRVAGNVAEPSAIGSLEYACEHLHAKVLVIMGHEKCGAVAAAASGEWMPSPNLHELVKRISPALANVQPTRDAGELGLRQVAANVDKSADDILKYSPILTRAVENGDLTIIRTVYHLKSGEVERLVSDPSPTPAPKSQGPAMAGGADHGH